MFRKNYTKEEFIDAVKNSTSIAGVLRMLNLKPVGGNYYTVKRKISQHSLDCSHFNGQSWSKGLKLKNWCNYKGSNSLKLHLIKQLGHRCEECLNEFWNGKKIAIELHHNDGDRTNNDLENLRLLCPNCHACTKNWRGRKNIITNIVDRTSGREISIKQKRVFQTKIAWPEKKELIALIESKSLSSIARDLGVSDNAVRKRAKKYNINIREISRWSQRHGDRSKDSLL